jgi:methylenetetrahydrofolate dehydrogenase (NADP+)/methenyltetrahydrofolate cyclohydrolase
MTTVGQGARGTGRGEARLLYGAPIATAIRDAVGADVAALVAQNGRAPGITIVLVGDDAASRVYASRILRNADSVGLPGELLELPRLTTAAALRGHLQRLNADPSVAGIIIQMPLPGQISKRDVIESIDPLKDIDGIHPVNVGLAALGHRAFVPSCAEAALEILKAHGEPIIGKRAVVIGRSEVVGRPVAALLLRESATVTICHRRTRDLAAEVRGADVVVVAAGIPGLVTGDMVAPGATVVDCGINVVDEQIVGDVDLPSVMLVAGAVTPVPGGVGPVTNAVLLRHVVRAARAALERQAALTAR